ncbi:Apyrase [Auxenochlorella protothecoides]|uniref:Apyrase n=1 Tax=Auxenochlorella protothecoides TaxID=3075 RepID=A0A087SQ20_AUXPR|nr:Apyrase [Auxenochlorella protothecoides]KFM27824.1 Apyrase [Auxenochlorella protothecoides]
MGKGREGRWDLVRRHRVLLTVLSIPVVLVLLVLGIMPRASPLDPRYGASKAADASTQQAKFSVVIDAGSTGSRVHIFKFLTSAAGAQDLQFDKFEQLKPGLSSYAADPKAAAASLKPLLALALETIPEALHAQTHVSVGATAGLRMLPGTKADEILAEVRALLKTYPFQSAASDVSILTGVNEGAFAWLTLNYLLGRLGEHEDRTVAAIDLGGGSVQEAFAMTAEEAAGAPHANYTTTLSGGGRRYSVYVYSYLGYGLMAGRAGLQCSFNGAWGGGRVPSVFYISSYFWDRAVDAGLVPETAAIEARVKPAEFKKLADKACSAKLADLGTLFPNVQEAARPFFCMDLCYVHTLLLEGFRVPEETEVTIVKKVQYKKEQVEAAWPLGAAINSLG